MKTKVASNAEPPLREFATRLSAELDNEFLKRTPDGNARSTLLLQSPDGSIWAAAVSDLGVLTATKVYG